MSSQLKKDFRNSLEDDSWATISISEDSENLSVLSEPDNLLQPVNNNHDADETDLDETLPIDVMNEIDSPDGIGPAEMKPPVHVLPSRARSDFLQGWGTPVPPKNMRDFQPVHCSSSLQPTCEGFSKDIASFDFSPQFCSSKLVNQQLPISKSDMPSSVNKPRRPVVFKGKLLKQPAPIIREICNLKPYARSVSSTLRMGSEEFEPQRCSTGLSESQLKLNQCPIGLEENSNFFVPLRSSTGISKPSSPPLPSTPYEFAPYRCSTGLQENSVAFMPLRSSTGLNDSAAFNPPVSSTFQSADDSNILEFKNLRLRSKSNLLT